MDRTIVSNEIDKFLRQYPIKYRIIPFIDTDKDVGFKFDKLLRWKIDIESIKQKKNEKNVFVFTGTGSAKYDERNSKIPMTKQVSFRGEAIMDCLGDRIFVSELIFRYIG